MLDSVESSRFLQACNHRPPATKPIWLMRQAGRILKPYRDLKEKTGSLSTLFKTPELAAEITLMPVEMLNVDAAILFTDLVTPLEPMGCDFEYRPGPVFSHPVQSKKDVERLGSVDVETDLPYVLETIRLVRRALPPTVPLIGYGGGPFTMASWMVEGEGSRDFTALRRLLYSDPGSAHLLFNKLSGIVIDYLRAQIRAGVQAIQLFDTSIGLLSPAVFKCIALPYLQRIFSALEGMEIPRIYFAFGATHLLPSLAQVGADVMSVDWRADLAQTSSLFGDQIPLQGNLDPCVLLSPPQTIIAETKKILQSTEGMSHIFNLGHGVLPQTPLDHVRILIDTVHEYSGKK